MTSREIVRAVLTFDHPPRIAMTLPAPYPNDCVGTGYRVPGFQPVALELRPGEVKRWRDEWGCTWATLTTYDKGEVVEPAIAEWADLDAYRPPDLGQPAGFEEMRRTFAAEPDRFRVAWIPGLIFSVARNLRKLENYLCDLALEPDNVGRLHAIVRAELLRCIDGCAAAGADAIAFCEDWGMQDRLMISPAMWREIFKPEFAALAGRAREHGMFVLMHSCGKMTEIIEDCIETGVSAFQFDQPRLHGIERLGERFGGRASFWCPVDIQRTLQTRDPRRIREDARLLIEHLGGHGGGFIAGYYYGNDAIGLAPQVQEHACRAFVEFGQYRGAEAR